MTSLSSYGDEIGPLQVWYDTSSKAWFVQWSEIIPLGSAMEYSDCSGSTVADISLQEPCSATVVSGFQGLSGKIILELIPTAEHLATDIGIVIDFDSNGKLFNSNSVLHIHLKVIYNPVIHVGVIPPASAVSLSLSEGNTCFTSYLFLGQSVECYTNIGVLVSSAETGFFYGLFSSLAPDFLTYTYSNSLFQICITGSVDSIQSLLGNVTEVNFQEVCKRNGVAYCGGTEDRRFHFFGNRGRLVLSATSGG